MRGIIGKFMVGAVAVGAVAVSAVALTALPASAQQVCGERTAILDQLKREFNETPSGKGMSSNGAVVEFLSSESGTWTMLVTFPSGATCLLAAGDNWRSDQNPARVAERTT